MAQENTTDTQPEVKPELRFGPFCLEAATRLWRADRPVYLRPRSLALLRYLAERSGQLVTREELLKALST
jgi:DNA-binding winged helix-turn-helix (wHTH) protein